MMKMPYAAVGRRVLYDQICRPAGCVVNLIDERLIAQHRCDLSKMLSRPDGDDRIAADPVPTYSPKQACLQGAQTVVAKGANATVCSDAIAEVIAKVPSRRQDGSTRDVSVMER